MPAWSATWAEGKSWAVSMVMGSRRRCMAMRAGRVTFLRVEAVVAERGEWDECRHGVRVVGLAEGRVGLDTVRAGMGVVRLRTALRRAWLEGRDMFAGVDVWQRE